MKPLCFLTASTLLIVNALACRSTKLAASKTSDSGISSPRTILSRSLTLALDPNIKMDKLTASAESARIAVQISSEHARTNLSLRGAIVGTKAPDEAINCDRLPVLVESLNVNTTAQALSFSLPAQDFLLVDVKAGADGGMHVTPRHYQMYPGRHPRLDFCVVAAQSIVAARAMPFAYSTTGKTERAHAPGLALTGASDSLTDASQYAEYCYQQIGARLPDGPYQCKKVPKIPFNLNGVPYTGTTTPPTCDTPSWLERDCVTSGNAYLQRLDTGSADVAAVMMCRHKLNFTDENSAFNDIAIIMHNRKSGGTCWFQGLGIFDGDKVVAPHQDTTHSFWMQPNSAKNITCSSCHDSGPWLGSPHSLLSKRLPRDDHGPYHHIGAAFADNFPEPQFVDVGDKGLGDPNASNCTTCHKIGKYSTCLEWVAKMTGRNFFDRTSEYMKTFPRSVHMPPAHGFDSQAEFDRTYGPHIDAILQCCQESYRPGPHSDWCKVGTHYDEQGLVNNR